jgi:hypothetical protein
MENKQILKCILFSDEAKITSCSFTADINWLLKNWKKLVEDMSRNKYFFQVRISHVLLFISICDLFTDSPSYVQILVKIRQNKNNWQSTWQATWFSDSILLNIHWN